MWDKWLGCWIRWRWWLAGAALLLVVLAWQPAGQVAVDRSVESLFRQGDPRYQDFIAARQLFGGVETAIVAYDDTDLLTAEGLERLGQFRQRLMSIPGVVKVTCLDDARRPSAIWDNRSLAVQLRRGAVTPEQLSREILNSRLYRGRLISESGDTAILWVELAAAGGGAAGHDRESTIRHLRQAAADLPFPSTVSGGPVLLEDVVQNLEYDGQVLSWVSAVVLSLVMLVLFRNIRWILLPIAVVQASVLWTKAILAISGTPLSMVSSPLVALVMVIGVATVVHVTLGYGEARRRAAPLIALPVMARRLGPAIFWTCATTMAGFGALLCSSLGPARSFGLMMAVGTGLVLIAVVTLTPALVLAFPSWPEVPGRVPGERFLRRGLRRLAAAVLRYPGPIALVLLLLLLLAAGGIGRLRVATDFTENFRRQSPIVQSFEFLSARLEGIQSFDILINVPATESRDIEAFLKRVRDMQAELEADPEVTATMSLADVLIWESDSPVPPPESTPGSWTQRLGQMTRTLPSALPLSTRLTVLQSIEPRLVDGFWNRQQEVVRVLVQVRHVSGAASKRQQIARLESIAQSHFASARGTGLYILLIFVVQSLLADQWTTFAVAAVAIGLMLSLAFRDFRLAALALVPNIAAILVVLGTMGWLGMKINLASAMLASVALGLSVDFSIHYLHRYQWECRAGRSWKLALRRAHGSVGLAMVLANLALIAGFLVLLLSPLIPTVHFGLLVSVAMLGGLLGNLVVLPLLLSIGKWKFQVAGDSGGKSGPP